MTHYITGFLAGMGIVVALGSALVIIGFMYHLCALAWRLASLSYHLLKPPPVHVDWQLMALDFGRLEVTLFNPTTNVVAVRGGIYGEQHVTTTTQRRALRSGAHDTRPTTRSDRHRRNCSICRAVGRTPRAAG